jgi:3-oxoadipate enol-lactonase / 4-carboxymuconolactone decarboxylase
VAAVSETNAPLQHRIDGPEDGPVLVLGPALGATWNMWDRQVPELSRHWRVMRYDLPGHGGAHAVPAYSVSDLAERLLATLDELEIERFGYAGCSLGAAVGAELALGHPLRIGSLALVSASPRFGTADGFRDRGVVVRHNGIDPVARGICERWFTPAFAAAQPAIADWAGQMVSTTDPDCYAAACEALAAFDIRAELSSIGVPTLVLAGAEDQETPPAEARVLVAKIPDARLALVPGASHLVPVEQPTAVTNLLARHFTLSWPSLDHPTSTTAFPTVAPRPALTAGPSAQAAEPGAVDRPEPAADPPADPYDEGMKVRRAVLGDAHVDRAEARADDFTADFQDFITRYAWGSVWTRPGIDRRTRSVITLTALVSRGYLDELAFHIRAALRNGLTPAEIKEVLLQTAIYCGVPAANSAFAVAQGVIREETSKQV